MPLGPLRFACVQPAPKSRFVVPDLLRYEDQKPQRALRCLDSTPHSLNKHETCRSALARDLPGTGSKSCVCGLPDTAEVFGLTTTSQQIAGKMKRHPGRSHALRAEAKQGSNLAHCSPGPGS
jgi:hypothetical protein